LEVKAMKVEEIITARIMEKLEQGTVPWHKPWAKLEVAALYAATHKEVKT
jgi:antirestriction protein ArdC